MSGDRMPLSPRRGRQEVKTDNIIRDYFQNFSDEIIIEQQSSQNPAIDKLLQYASKRGMGKGYPDFIIQYKNDKNLIIVVECKSDKRFHESDTHKEYEKYAVDGVLLYSSFLSKEFDVVAIAVSGTTGDDLKVSHYIHLKDEPKAYPYFGESLLRPSEYREGLNASDEKKRQDYDKLLDYTRVLNTKLHSLKIDEAERCILASCILLALRLPQFKNYYYTEDNQSILANRMINDVIDWFRKENVGLDKIEIIQSKYAAIRGMFAQQSDHNYLRDLIRDMEENIDAFEKTNRYYDVLGQLYVAFLRYANTSNDLGVVLTPSHITEFFADIAEVNKTSVVLDNCTGTCGFLISAMSKMIEDARGDVGVEKSIKSNQLIGIEKGDKMYCLAASNMAIHGDGKTNIYPRSGLDPVVIEEIKRGLKDSATGKIYRPTIGMLNPPYKADKKNDVEELEFVKWNLEALMEGGVCVAILPMQCAIGKKGNTIRLKEELLDKHTLEAVFSMPDELFYNSDKSVVTCIMVFTAHKKHPENKETFFGYFKDDGFEKRKILGRIDVHGRWEKIKEGWLYLYRKRKEMAGMSVMHHVGARDEWCAEAYMETDYSCLNDRIFIDNLRAYSSFLLKYDNPKGSKNYSNRPMQNRKISLDERDYGWFSLTEIFEKPYKGKAYNAQDLTIVSSEDLNAIRYVTRTDENNGLKGYVENDNFLYVEEGNAITIGDTTSTIYYQEEEFICGDHIVVLRSRNLNKYRAMFLVSVLNLERFRYCYGRAFTKDNVRRTKIKLPVDSSGAIDWNFMESYIKGLNYSSNL